MERLDREIYVLGQTFLDAELAAYLAGGEGKN